MTNITCARKLSERVGNNAKAEKENNCVAFTALSKEAACYAAETNDYLLYRAAGEVADEYIEQFSEKYEERERIYGCMLKSFFISVSQTRGNLFSINEELFSCPSTNETDLAAFSSFCEKVISHIYAKFFEEVQKADILTDLKILVEENCR